ncbi:hypothetical protein OJAV_G00127510 [Oryzias javanicus]|uniref:EGF-like domain-containing protein n=1 Tax=Oryzias javanicus TaxID=123683 RepID=A0A437CP85_ORYJA|nr:hypothetical protein OJAV_G00127510 [Oryzias javanicus]
MRLQMRVQQQQSSGLHGECWKAGEAEEPPTAALRKEEKVVEKADQDVSEELAPDTPAPAEPTPTRATPLPDPCEGRPCLNGGLCLALPSAGRPEENWEYMCTCSQGFTGRNCEDTGGSDASFRSSLISSEQLYCWLRERGRASAGDGGALSHAGGE